MKLIHGKNPLPIRPMAVGMHGLRRKALRVEMQTGSRYEELRVKEVLHIHLTPEDQRFNRDVGLERVSTLEALLITTIVGGSS